MNKYDNPDIIKVDITDATYGPGFFLLFIPLGGEYNNYEVNLGHENFKKKEYVIVCSLSKFSTMEEMINTILHEVPVLHDTLEMYIKHYFGYEDCKTVKALRYKKRMTQNDFADFFGIPVSTLRKWEQGVNPVPEYVFNMMKSILANDITI